MTKHNTPKHTPGPWAHDGSYWTMLLIAGSNGSPVCTIVCHTDYNGYADPTDSDKADAALIAAAPDLLAIAHDWLNVMEADDYDCTCYEGDECPLCRCKAAVAKAEGRTL